MGWCTELFCNITFNRETFNSKFEVEDKIKELKKYIKTAKDELRDLLVMTEPNKFCPEDCDALNWLRQEFHDLTELIDEYTVDLYKLNLLLDNWDACHDKNGLAIDPPDGIDYETAFLDGSFVKTVKHPDIHSILD